MAKGITNCSTNGNNTDWGIITLTESASQVVVTHNLKIKPTKAALIPNYYAQYRGTPNQLSLGYYGFDIGVMSADGSTKYKTGLTRGSVQSETGLYIQLFRSHQEYASVANSKTITFKTTIDGQEYENAVAPGTYYWFAIVE